MKSQWMQKTFGGVLRDVGIVDGLCLLFVLTSGLWVTKSVPDNLFTTLIHMSFLVSLACFVMRNKVPEMAPKVPGFRND